jgi:hypothetical protein
MSSAEQDASALIAARHITSKEGYAGMGKMYRHLAKALTLAEDFKDGDLNRNDLLDIINIRKQLHELLRLAFGGRTEKVIQQLSTEPIPED